MKDSTFVRLDRFSIACRRIGWICVGTGAAIIWLIVALNWGPR